MTIIAYRTGVAVPVSALVFAALAAQYAGLPGSWLPLAVAGLLTAGLSAVALLRWETADVARRSAGRMPGERPND
jgi:hypothetical protein